MTYSTLILVVLVFHCYGINGNDAEEETQITPQKGSSPVSNAGLIIQQVTSEIDNVGPVFWFQRKHEILFANEKVNGSLLIWDISKGETKRYYIKELEKEKIITVTPNKMNPEQLIIGSDLNLRMYQKYSSGYTITTPQVTFNESGYIIYAAYGDQDGVLTTVLVPTDSNNKKSKLYKVKNKRAIFIKDFDKKPGDFRFNDECTKMFMIYDHGRKITQTSYNMNKSEFGDDVTEVFDKDDYTDLKNHTLMSIVPDRDPGHLWVVAAGKIGYLLEINPNNKTLVGITPLPIKDVTFMTFGNQDYKTLFVGSTNACTKDRGQGSIYSITGTERVGPTSKPMKW